jgi:tetratricopeptide (TPR) repeat protein
MKFISSLLYLYLYLKGAVRFRSGDYTSAEQLFEKAKKYCPEKANGLFFQYYGQTLLSLGKIDESFKYLSEAYDINSEIAWKAASEDEYSLAKDTIDALKYLADNYSLKTTNFDPNIKIIRDY